MPAALRLKNEHMPLRMINFLLLSSGFWKDNYFCIKDPLPPGGPQYDLVMVSLTGYCWNFSSVG